MTPAEIEALVKAEVDRRLREIFAPVVQPEQSLDEWVDVNVATEKLGYPSKKALYDAIAKGLLRIGTAQKPLEVRDRRPPGSKRPCYQFHLQRCQDRLNGDSEARRAV